MRGEDPREQLDGRAPGACGEEPQAIHLISPEQFDVLYGPWREVIGDE